MCSSFRALARRAVLVAFLLVACAPAPPSIHPPPSRLLVVNALDGTVTQIDPERAVVVGPTIPVGPSPWQVAEGPAGSLVVLSSAVDEIGRLTHVSPSARQGGPWKIAHIPIGLRVRSGFLAADGLRFAVVAYSQTAGTGTAIGGSPLQPAFCGIDVVDVTSGRVVGAHGVCAAGREAVTGLALTTGPSGAVAIVGVSHQPAESARRADGLSNRLVAIAVSTGHVLASVFVAGAPSNLVLAPDRAASAQRLHTILTPWDPAREHRAERSTLLTLDPDTLAPQRQVDLPLLPGPLVLGAGSGAAYALDGEGTALLHIDLASGAHRHLADLPGRATSLAAAAGGLFVPHAYGATTWRFDPSSGALTHTIPVGRHPTAITRLPA